MIIVDDCSDDKSTDVVHEYTNDNRIQLIINKTNKGAGYCRNLAIKKAKGEFIAFVIAMIFGAKINCQNIWSLCTKKFCIFTYIIWVH